MRHIVKDTMLLLAGALICAVAFVACGTVAPTEADVKEAISRHFESRGYKVLDLQTGYIQAIPMGEKTYMGTPAFNVQVSSITLAAAPERGAIVERTFTNAIVRIKEQPGQKGKWIVTNIEGMPVK
jgi:hypothetical protein